LRVRPGGRRRNGNTNAGAVVAMHAISSGKHIVMLNVETDVTVGCILEREAEKAGVVYTGSAGDEPAAVKELMILRAWSDWKHL
jgi:predicted homoserine dehydrogenase-like protein